MDIQAIGEVVKWAIAKKISWASSDFYCIKKIEIFAQYQF